MSKLQQTIAEAKVEVQKRKDASDKELAEKLNKEQTQHQKNVEYEFNRLTKNDLIFDLIKQSVICGKNSCKIPNSGKATYDAIKSHPDVFEGITAILNSGCDYIHSDEIKSDWEHVEINWKS